MPRELILNKPINANPHNTWVDKNEDIHLKYEIPQKRKIDGYSITVSDIVSGEKVLEHTSCLETPSSNIDFTINNSLSEFNLTDPISIVLKNSTSPFSVDVPCGIAIENTALVVNGGDSLKISIVGGDFSDDFIVPLYTETEDDSIMFNDISDNKWKIVHEKFHDMGQMISSKIEISVSPNQEGYENGTATLQVSCIRQSSDEYSWETFYWAGLKNIPHSQYTVCGKTDDKLFLKPIKEKVLKAYTTKYNVTSGGYINYIGNIARVMREYTKNLYDSMDHEEGEDTSKYCEKGQLTDYFGYYGCFIHSGNTGTGSLTSTIENTNMGKCILEIYDQTDILAFRGRIVAIDVDFGDVFVIFDQATFCKDGLSRIDTARVNDQTYDCYLSSRIVLYNLDDIEKDVEAVNGLIQNEKDVEAENGSKQEKSDYYYIHSTTFNKHCYSLQISPSVASTDVGDVVSLWQQNSGAFVYSPLYYFRTKTPPQCEIEGISNGDIVKDFKVDVKITHDSKNCWLNYFYFKLYKYNPASLQWDFKKKSPFLFDSDEPYVFELLSDKGRYKITGVCVDTDGDEWSTPEVQFDTDVNMSKFSVPVYYREISTSIRLDIRNLLSAYKTAKVELYKTLRADSVESDIQFVSKGLAKSDDFVYYDKVDDYNIKNKALYNYYARIEYIGKETSDDSGEDFFLIANDVAVDFDGSSIIGLKKLPDGSLSIDNNFKIMYKLGESEPSEIKNEIKRDYIDSFSRYQKELRGYTNFKTGSCSGLLGTERNGEYIEAREIKEKWIDFVNDDTIKLYRSYEGDAMIVSIDSSSVSPHIYADGKLVNEIKFSYKEISPTDMYMIFAKEKTGD